MYKRWLLGFLLLSLIIASIIEVNYQLNRKQYYRHAEDYAVNKLLAQQKNRDYKTIIMGDSVIHWAMEGMKLDPSVYDMTVTGSMTIVGQYMMLNRYLKYNKAPDEVYMFFIPEAFKEDTENTRPRIESIFDEEGEAELIKKVKLGQFSDESNYFYDRVRILKPWKQYFAKGNRSIDKSSVLREVSRDKTYEIVDQTMKERHLTKVVENTFKELQSLCKNNGISLILVLEPMQYIRYKAYENSDLDKFFKSKNIGIIDFRTIYEFEDKLFYDGLHLNQLNADLFMYKIDQNITTILKMNN